MAKKHYTYALEVINFANGKHKDTLVYDSPARLKIANVYFSLPDLPVGAYKVVKEIKKGDKDEE